MPPYKCKCGNPIAYTHGKCKTCKDAEFQTKLNKRVQHLQNKYRNTQVYGHSRVKHESEAKFWATSHANCFRGSPVGKGETEAHLDKKYERWKYHRSLGRTVYCELIFSHGRGRADLVIVDKGFVFIEEVVKSESEASIVQKKNKYPFPVVVIRCDKIKKVI